MKKFLARYEKLGEDVLENDESPSLTNAEYYKIRQRILHKAMNTLVQTLDFNYIDFLLDNEAHRLKVSAKVCKIFFEG